MRLKLQDTVPLWQTQEGAAQISVRNALPSAFGAYLQTTPEPPTSPWYSAPACCWAVSACRFSFLVPRLGERVAELVEMPIQFIVMVFAARFVVHSYTRTLVHCCLPCCRWSPAATPPSHASIPVAGSCCSFAELALQCGARDGPQGLR